MAATRETGGQRRLIEAAIDCILEQGFYRASTNAIAERAGVTWGVIQYHFGTRENLMLAVLQEAAARLQQTLAMADVDAASLSGRLEQLFEILANYYGQPSFVAFTEVQLNLSHDPRTAESTRENLMRINEPVRLELDRLMSQVLSDTAADSPEIRSLIFHVLRGLSISEVMLGSQPWDTPTAPRFRFLHGHPRLAAEALSLLIERRNPETGKRD
jgi:AcrR family transcriptional regulator